jgi:hypothetical protein
MIEEKVQPVCNRCGSADILADAYASWNFETQEWEISQAFDKGAFCPDCDGETKIHWKGADE